MAITASDVWRMLDHCVGADSWSKEEREHRWWVHAKGRTHRGLPLGPHGKRRDVEMQPGKVRTMAREFEILDCAKEFLGI